MDGNYCLRKVLDQLTDDHGTADIILRNGFHITGSVVGWDSQSVLIEVNGRQQLILLHNVSTIVPEKLVDL